MGRYRQVGVERDLALLEALEQQVEGHDFGERSRMARAVGIARLHDRAGIHVDHDRCVGGVVAFARIRAQPKSPAGVGIVCQGRDGDTGRQAQDAPAQATTAKNSPTRHSLSPNPVLWWRSPRPLSWPFCSLSASRQFMTVGERGLQIIKAIPRILKGFLHCDKIA